MIYLHKSVFQSHGYLSSANCHVDNRWVLKVSGFALHAFRKEDDREQVNRVNAFCCFCFIFTVGPTYLYGGYCFIFAVVLENKA